MRMGLLLRRAYVGAPQSFARSECGTLAHVPGLD